MLYEYHIPELATGSHLNFMVATIPYPRLLNCLFPVNFKLKLFTCMRKGLDETFQEQVVGIGGCFLTLGKTVTKVHVMPKFSTTPLNSDADVANWLQFFDANAPLTHLSFMTSRDVADLDVRIEHTHCFSSHGHGGHYHYDVGNKEDVEYEGYFQVAEKIYRVDQPTVTHAVGRD